MAKAIIERWPEDYTQQLPPISLGQLIPDQFIMHRQVIQIVEDIGRSA
jgi:hypothetical protein